MAFADSPSPFRDDDMRTVKILHRAMRRARSSRAPRPSFLTSVLGEQVHLSTRQSTRKLHAEARKRPSATTEKEERIGDATRESCRWVGKGRGEEAKILDAIVPSRSAGPPPATKRITAGACGASGACCEKKRKKIDQRREQTCTGDPSNATAAFPLHPPPPFPPPLSQALQGEG